MRFLSLALAILATSAQAQPHPVLKSGPMLGYAEMTETVIWTQTKSPAQVHVEFRPLNAQTWTKSQVVEANSANDHIALVKLTDLPMGTKFEYRLFINGQLVPRDYPLQFQTQPHWRWATNPPQPPEFTIALGSCAYFNETRPGFDRPGTPYGGDYELFDALHAKRPDLMLWLGDNFYHREMDWLTESAMRNRWRTDRAHPSIQPLLASTHNYATWDDHDFGPNNSDASFRLKDTSLQIHKEYWPQVVYGTPETKGVFTRFEWADVEVFMLDNRYHRTPNNFPFGPEKVMLGKAQVEWLKQSLVNSDKTFKIIACGGQMINPITLYEAFGDYPNEQADLFNFIAQQGITGVLFLSGDRHHTELLKVRWPGSDYPWLEYTSSPLGSGAGAGGAAEQENPARVPGTFVTRTRNFGLIKVSGPWRNRKLTLTAHDKTGQELWKHEVTEQQMRPQTTSN